MQLACKGAIFGVSTPLLLGDGSTAAPSYSFTNSTGTGLVYDAANARLLISVNGVQCIDLKETTFTCPSSLRLGLAADLFLINDGADTLALKNANNEQQFNIYSGNGAYGLIRSKQELVTTTAAATAATAAGFIPDGAVPLAISTYVQTAITTAGLTGYNIGDGVDADRWGAIVGHAVGTKSNNSDWTATTIQAFIAAQAITLTAVGANFPAGGKIRVCMTYILSSEPTS